MATNINTPTFMIHNSITHLGPKRIAMLALCCIAVVAGQAAAQEPQYDDSQKPGQRKGAAGQRAGEQSGQHFVQQAAIAGLKEVRLGQIAAQQAQDSEVKQFAQQMVQDHSTANQKLAEIAKSKGYPIPSTNTFTAGLSPTGRDREFVRERETTRPGRPESDTVPYDRQRVSNAEESSPSPEQHRQSIQKLQALSGTEFDRAYMNETVKDHAKAVQLFQNASQNLQDPELKQFATETLPKLTHHHQMAQQLASKIGGDSQNPQNPLNQDRDLNETPRNQK